MMFNGLLPIGSVVLLKEANKRVMITGVAQVTVSNNSQKLYDYVGCPFPEGFQSVEENLLFNNEQIDKLFFIGLMDAESMSFKEQLDSQILDIRAKIENAL